MPNPAIHAQILKKCEEVSMEQDSVRFAVLVAELNFLLEQKGIILLFTEPPRNVASGLSTLGATVRETK